jgi:hypothetical protein
MLLYHFVHILAYYVYCLRLKNVLEYNQGKQRRL